MSVAPFFDFPSPAAGEMEEIWQVSVIARAGRGKYEKVRVPDDSPTRDIICTK